MNAVELRDFLTNITGAVSNICKRHDGTVVHDPASAQGVAEALRFIADEADAGLARMEAAGLIMPSGRTTPPVCRFGPGGDYTVNYTPAPQVAGEVSLG